jgi:hypothetical protein
VCVCVIICFMFSCVFCMFLVILGSVPCILFQNWTWQQSPQPRMCSVWYFQPWPLVILGNHSLFMPLSCEILSLLSWLLVVYVISFIIIHYKLLLVGSLCIIYFVAVIVIVGEYPDWQLAYHNFHAHWCISVMLQIFSFIIIVSNLIFNFSPRFWLGLWQEFWVPVCFVVFLFTMYQLPS